MKGTSCNRTRVRSIYRIICNQLCFCHARVLRTGSGFALHLKDLEFLSKEILLVLRGPLVDFFSHGRRRRNGKDEYCIVSTLYRGMGVRVA